MADTMQFDLVSPERSLASLQASEVQIPGAEGDMTALPDHTPVITTLRPGILTVTGEGATTRYVVTGGFAEITAESTSVLAERAMAADEMTQEMFGELVAEAEAAQGAASGAAADAAGKALHELTVLGAELGLSR